jgi:hypothetical protein
MQQGPPTPRVAPPEDGRKRGTSGPPTGLTRAEVHALRRSAPLTQGQFKELGRLAEHRVSPLRLF